MARGPSPKRRAQKPQGLQQFDSAVVVPSTNHVYGSSGVQPVECRQAQSRSSLRDIAQSLEDLYQNEDREFALLLTEPGTSKVQCHTSLDRSKNTLGKQKLSEKFARAVKHKHPEYSLTGRSEEVSRTCRARNPEGKHHVTHQPLFESNSCALAGLNRPQSAARLLIIDDDDDGADEKQESFYKDEENFYESVAVGDEERMNRFFDDALELCQATNLKRIVKAWIKIIHPKKQTSHPYNGGITKNKAIREFGNKDMAGYYTKPVYWPDDVRHLRPDSLNSEELHKLVKSILRYAGTSSEALRNSTNDVTRGLKGRNGEEVCRLLNEVYFVRAKEERFERGEMYGDAEFQVRRLSQLLPQTRKASKKTKAIQEQPAAIPGKPLIGKKRPRAPSTPSSSDEPLPIPDSNLGTEIGTNDPSAGPFSVVGSNNSLSFQQPPQAGSEWDVDTSHQLAGSVDTSYQLAGSEWDVATSSFQLAGSEWDVATSSFQSPRPTDGEWRFAYPNFDNPEDTSLQGPHS